MRGGWERIPLLILLPGLLLVLQVVFTLLLVLGALVPDGPLVRGIASHTEPGRTWGLPEADGVGGSGTPTTDQAVMTSGLGRPELDPWSKAMFMPRLEAGTPGHEQLSELAQNRTLDTELRGYFRYWAGYTVITRPVLALWELPGMRLAVGALFVGAAWAAGRGMVRRWSPWQAVAIAGPLLLASNVVMLPAVSMSHTLSWATTLAGLWLLAVCAPRGLRAMLLATTVGAAAYQFIDLLTNPVVPWALSAALAAAFAWRHTGEVRTLIQHGLAVGLVWPLAWALTWVGRWCLAVLTVGPTNAFRDIGGQVESRLDLGVTGVRNGFGAATARNLSYWWETLPTAPVLLMIGAAALGAFLLHVARGRTHLFVPFLMLCMPILTVPAWYELFSNHSQIHAAFTYRYVPLALGLLLFAVVSCWREPHRKSAAQDGSRAERAEPSSATSSPPVAGPPIP